MSGRRVERVSEAVREVIAELLVRDVKDPRIGMITITSVVLTPDLRHARVYFSCIGDAAAQQRVLAGLQSATGFIKTQVMRQLKLRYAPDLMFVFDPSLASAQHMAELLRTTKRPED